MAVKEKMPKFGLSMEEGILGEWLVPVGAAVKRGERPTKKTAITRPQLEAMLATCDDSLEGLRDKWEAFGWEVSELDGNDVGALLHYFHTVQNSGKPHCLIAHTVKGRGLPFAENRMEWHHKVPTAEQLTQAYDALGVKGVDWL